MDVERSVATTMSAVTVAQMEPLVIHVMASTAEWTGEGWTEEDMSTTCMVDVA